MQAVLDLRARWNAIIGINLASPTLLYILESLLLSLHAMSMYKRMAPFGEVLSIFGKQKHDH